VAELEQSMRRAEKQWSSERRRAEAAAARLSEKVSFLEVNTESSTGLLEKARSEIELLKAELEEARRKGAAGQDELRAELEAATQRARNADRQVAETRTELHRLQEAGDNTAAEFEARRTALEARVAELESLAGSSAQERDGTIAELNAVRQKLKRAEEQLEASRKQREEAGAAADRTMQRLVAVEAELRESRETAARTERAAEARAAALEQQAAEAREALADSTQRLADAEQKAERQATEAARTIEATRRRLAEAEQKAEQQAREAARTIEQARNRLADAEQKAEQASAEAARTVAETQQKAAAAKAAGQAVSPERYLRVEGKVYGPVDLDTLYAWVCECRVAPDHEISEDRSKWVRAADIPELEMEWNVRLVDGSSYGPVNALSVPHLIADAVVAPNAIAEHTASGLKATAAEMASPVVLALHKRCHKLRFAGLKSRPAPPA
jgi:chromosome segregation ATPase